MFKLIAAVALPFVSVKNCAQLARIQLVNKKINWTKHGCFILQPSARTKESVGEEMIVYEWKEPLAIYILCNVPGGEIIRNWLPLLQSIQSSSREYVHKEVRGDRNIVYS